MRSRTHLYASYFKNWIHHPIHGPEFLYLCPISSDFMIDWQWSHRIIVQKIYIENYHLLLIKHLRMLAINKSSIWCVFMLFVSPFSHSLAAAVDRFYEIDSRPQHWIVQQTKQTEERQKNIYRRNIHIETRKAKQCHFFEYDWNIGWNCVQC